MEVHTSMKSTAIWSSKTTWRTALTHFCTKRITRFLHVTMYSRSSTDGESFPSSTQLWNVYFRLRTIMRCGHSWRGINYECRKTDAKMRDKNRSFIRSTVRPMHSHIHSIPPTTRNGFHYTFGNWFCLEKDIDWPVRQWGAAPAWRRCAWEENRPEKDRLVQRGLRGGSRADVRAFSVASQTSRCTCKVNQLTFVKHSASERRIACIKIFKRNQMALFVVCISRRFTFHFNQEMSTFSEAFRKYLRAISL